MFLRMGRSNVFGVQKDGSKDDAQERLKSLIEDLRQHSSKSTLLLDGDDPVDEPIGTPWDNNESQEPTAKSVFVEDTNTPRDDEESYKETPSNTTFEDSKSTSPRRGTENAAETRPRLRRMHSADDVGNRTPRTTRLSSSSKDSSSREVSARKKPVDRSRSFDATKRCQRSGSSRRLSRPSDRASPSETYEVGEDFDAIKSSEQQQQEKGGLNDEFELILKLRSKYSSKEEMFSALEHLLDDQTEEQILSQPVREARPSRRSQSPSSSKDYARQSSFRSLQGTACRSNSIDRDSRRARERMKESRRGSERSLQVSSERSLGLHSRNRTTRNSTSLIHMQQELLSESRRSIKLTSQPNSMSMTQDLQHQSERPSRSKRCHSFDVTPRRDREHRARSRERPPSDPLLGDFEAQQSRRIRSRSVEEPSRSRDSLRQYATPRKSSERDLKQRERSNERQSTQRVGARKKFPPDIIAVPNSFLENDDDCSRVTFI